MSENNGLHKLNSPCCGFHVSFRARSWESKGTLSMAPQEMGALFKTRIPTNNPFLRHISWGGDLWGTTLLTRLEHFGTLVISLDLFSIPRNLSFHVLTTILECKKTWNWTIFPIETWSQNRKSHVYFVSPGSCVFRQHFWKLVGLPDLDDDFYTY